MLHSQFKLLTTRRFLPLFLTQALGAFNDNLFKNALVILITFVLAERVGLDPSLMVTAAAGIFILPFFLFSATAGQLADRYDKAYMIRRVKLIEILLMGGAAIGFYLQSMPGLLSLLFLMGAQSALFGPLKYGILPDHLAREDLISANGLIQAATFLAILLGTMAGGLLILEADGVRFISLGVVGMALAGWCSSLFIPATGAAAPSLRVNPNFMAETWRIVAYAKRRPALFLPMLGVSWFWLVGATFLAQVPNFGKLVLGGNEQLVTLLLLAFSVGIGGGSLLCNLLLGGRVKGTYVHLGALGISVFTIDLYFASRGTPLHGAETLIDVGQFLASAENWRILVDVLLIAVSGGIYVVPLNTMIQARSRQSHRARNVAALNIMNALFMVTSALWSAAMLASGFSVPELFLVLALLNFGVVLISFRMRGA